MGHQGGVLGVADDDACHTLTRSVGVECVGFFFNVLTHARLGTFGYRLGEHGHEFAIAVLWEGMCQFVTSVSVWGRGFLVSVDDGTDLSRVKRENDDRSRSTASSVAGTGSFRRTWEAQVLIVIVLVVV